MWEKLYIDYENGEKIADINPVHNDVEPENLGRFEIVFDLDNIRYYCYIDAINMHEALGIFFERHPDITYNQLLDHMEV